MNQYLVVGIVFLVVIALLATNKKLVETLKNIYKIEELRKRVIYTIGLLLVYRLGSFVVIPGINPNALGEGSALASQLDGNGLLGLLNVFSGGAFGNAAIFALGVMPYITASIIIQLMGMMIPYFQKMQKEGESGRRKMNQWTRFLKGAQSRSGYSRKLGFEGGQMPLQRRLPKFGFTNLKRVEFKAINLSTLEELAAKKSLSEITVDTLVAAGFISSNDKVKILGNGTVTKALSVKAHAFSKSAEAAIVAAGGSVEKL